MADEWQYDKNKAFQLSVSMEEALAAPADHIVYGALHDLRDSEIGDKLVCGALAKQSRVTIDPDLPAYGLVIPGDQTVDGAPLVIMSGDLEDWRDDFCIYNWGHELSHIYQMDSKLLRNFPSWGVEYGATAPAGANNSHVLSLKKMRTHQELAEVILSERMADVIGVCATLQFADKHPDTRVKGVLGRAKEIRGLFNAVSSSSLRGQDQELVEKMMQPDSFSNDEWRYYMSYSRHLQDEAAGQFLQDFNRASVEKVAGDFLRAQCRMAAPLLGM